MRELINPPVGQSFAGMAGGGGYSLARDIAAHGDPIDFGGRETNYWSLFRASDKEVS